MKTGMNRRDLMALLGGGAVLAGLTPFDLQAQTASGTLKVSTRANPSSLDPMTGLAGDDTPVLWAVYATLLDFEFASLETRLG
jgi:ABC-type transport system substrate-binding protein